MSARRVVALFRRVILEIRRDRPSLALLFIAPVLVTGLVTFILREGVAPTIDAVIVNEAGAPGTAIAGALTRVIVDEGGTAATGPYEAMARSRIADGSASIAIVLPADLVGGASPTITVITNGLDPAGEANQVTALQRALLAAVSSVSGSPLPTIQHATVYGTPSDDPMVTYAPVLVGFFVYFFVYLLTGVSFLRERTGGTLERLMATPVARSEIVTGYTLGFGLFAVIQVAVMVLWTLGSLEVPSIGPLPAFSIGLGVQVNGNPLLAYLVVVILAMGAVSLGIFLSTFARTELQVIQFIPIVIVPQVLVSGVLFPLASPPAAARPFRSIMPLTYAVDGRRQVFVRGADLGVGALQLDLVVLAAFAVFFATIASLTIRRDVA